MDASGLDMDLCFFRGRSGRIRSRSVIRRLIPLIYFGKMDNICCHDHNQSICSKKLGRNWDHSNFVEGE